jgi:polyhydroxybutyrate depolymerase
MIDRTNTRTIAADTRSVATRTPVPRENVRGLRASWIARRGLGVGLVGALSLFGALSLSWAGGQSAAAATKPNTAGATSCTPTKRAAAGTTSNTYTFPGGERKYLLSVPKSYTGKRATPLIVNLHGFGSTAEEQNLKSQMPEKAGKRGYIVVAPQANDATVGTKTGPLWNYTAAYATLPDTSAEQGVTLPTDDDVAYINGLVGQLEDQLCIDTSREYVTGMSAGAGLTTWLMCQPTNRFAAAAPVAGLTQGLACPATDLPPFVAVADTADPQVTYTGGTLAGFKLGIPAVEDRMADFAKKQGCSATHKDTKVAKDVVHMVWKCPKGSAAELYKVIGGTHEWPGSPNGGPGSTNGIDTTSRILDFFDAHPGT